MVGIAVPEDANLVLIVGHGLTVTEAHELDSGITVDPNVPDISDEEAAACCTRFSDFAAVVGGRALPTFTLRIEGQPGQALAAKAWNALWVFHLLSLAAESHCCSLFSVSKGTATLITASNRNLGFSPFPRIAPITVSQLGWARQNLGTFNRLIADPKFSTAMRCLGNAPYLFEPDLQTMLLWAGIEGLLSVDAELSMRLALYTALIVGGSHQEKSKWFTDVKKAYRMRSKAVHGVSSNPKLFAEASDEATRILARLLRRCVEIGRVPTPAELDSLAINAAIA